MIKQSLRLVLNCLFLIFMVYVLLENQLVTYGLEQGWGQLNMSFESRPVQEVMADTEVSDSVKQRLELIAEIKQFSVDSLGLDPSDNYSSFYQQPKGSLLLTVSACRPYEFTAKEWCFPVLGCVSYKGFFNKSKAYNEINQLRSEGWDVDAYSPSGWSTLGWFKDPIQSNMLKKKEGELANLILHELTHGTLYVKNNVTFNENLASFIGDKGAELFLERKYGKLSEAYRTYEEYKADDSIYTAYMLQGQERLKKLYESFTPNINESVKKKQKNACIYSIVMGVWKLPLYHRQSFFRYSLQAFFEKNAFFMGFARYNSEYSSFENEFQNTYHSNLKSYLSYLKGKYPSL